MTLTIDNLSKRYGDHGRPRRRELRGAARRTVRVRRQQRRRQDHHHAHRAGSARRRRRRGPARRQARRSRRPPHHRLHARGTRTLSEDEGRQPADRILLELHGLSKRDATAAMQRWTERLGIAERIGDTVDSLSLGNQQRVQLAAALIHDPAVLVLDEPFSGSRPGRRRRDERGSRREGEHRCPGDLLEPPARSGAATVRARRHHRPWTHARRRCRRRTARRGCFPPGRARSRRPRRLGRRPAGCLRLGIHGRSHRAHHRAGRRRPADPQDRAVHRTGTRVLPAAGRP